MTRDLMGAVYDWPFKPDPTDAYVSGTDITSIFINSQRTYSFFSISYTF